MIDLSFLTEEEKETILAVLNRDAELKKAEEHRVENLQKTVSNKSRLKYLTGEWFYETKQRRHQDRIHGSDLIRASMRHTSKPLTILELSQILPERSSFVCSANKDVFVPPVLCGLIQEPSAQFTGDGYLNQNPYEIQQDTPKPVLQSPTKRKNPFNNELVFEENLSLDGATAQTQTAKTDVPDHHHLKTLSPAVLSFASTQQNTCKPFHHTEPEDEQDFQIKSIDRSTGHNTHVKATLVTQPSPDGSSNIISHAVSPKPDQRLLEREKNAQAQSSQKDPQNVPKQKDKATSDDDITLQLPGLHNTQVKDTESSSADNQQKATKGRTAHSSERLSTLRSFWERENSRKYIYSIEEEKPEDIAKTEVLHDVVTKLDVKTLNCSLLPHTEMVMTEQHSGSSSHGNPFLPPTGCDLLADLSKDDGTYRANPVLIYDETEDVLTCSVTKFQSSEPQENLLSRAPPSGAIIGAKKQEEHIPSPFPRQSSSTDQEPQATKETSSSPVPDLNPFTNNRETSAGEAQTSPYGASTIENVTDKAFVSQVLDRAHLRNSDSPSDEQMMSLQYQVKAATESQERSISPSRSQPPRSKEEDDKARRSPSKTCHPKALPRESSGAKASVLEGSPLKTFQIDISPETKLTKEQQGKPTPVPRQRTSPSHAAKQTVVTDTGPGTDLTSSPPPLHSEDRVTNFSQVTAQKSNTTPPTSPQSKKPSDKELGTQLARAVIPQDHQHYLGPQERAHIPDFHQEKADNAEKERQQSISEDFVENQSDNPTERNPPRIASRIMESKDENASGDATTKAWSFSRTSSGSYGEGSHPVMSALRRLSSRGMSSSKSHENLTSETREQRILSNSKELFSSVNDVSSLSPSASTAMHMKACASVPVLQQDETDSDGIFETNLGSRRNTSSSMSNLSISSGMASMSSISGSMSSIYPADFGAIDVQGSIQFAATYIQKLGEFHMFVVLCRDLAVADTKKNRSDPYVKCYLLPDKTKLGKRKTKVKKKTLNPIYNEMIGYKIDIETLKSQILNVSVWHNDTFGRNVFLGEVNLNFAEWDFSNTQINEYTLKARAPSQNPPLCLMDVRGQMRVALRFLPQTSHSKRTSRTATGEVQIWVKDCKNLPPVRGIIIDPFVKCTVLPDVSRKSRQKTRVVKRTANPMFNHTMVYDGFRAEDLREACVEITVWDHDRLKNHYIGGLRLGLGTGKSYGVEVDWMDSTSDEVYLWQRMLQSDGEWVEDVLPLRVFVMAKNMPQ